MLAIGKLVALLHAVALDSSVHLLLKVLGNVARTASAYVAAGSEVTTIYIQTIYGIGKGL